MANTLTNLIPDLYAAMDVVSRELTGFIPAVTMDAQVDRAAVGQAVYVPVTPAAAATDITPAVTPPNDGDQTIGNTPITITKARRVPFRWNGEEQRGINTGPGYLSIRQNQIAQAIRTLVNEMESDLGALYVRSSRAYGTAGTTPFGTSTYVIDDLAQVLKILKDNGAPNADLQCILDTSAGARMRSIPGLNKVNEAGNDTLLRQGVLGDVLSFAVRESAGVAYHTASTSVSSSPDYNIDNVGGYDIGDTTLHLEAGTGTHVAGDVLTINGDSNKYIIGAGATGSGDKDITLNAPGLRLAVDNDTAVETGASYRANMAFHRSAMVLAARAPALPEEGDMAVDRMLVTDPRTGLTFEVSMYAQYRQIQYEVAMAWGAANIKPEHTAILLG